MGTQTMVKQFKKYQSASPIVRKAYFRAFEEKMIYRTTKTENPETTLRLVRKTLKEIARN